MSMKEEEMIEKLRKEVEIPDKVRQKANEAFASIKKDAGAGAAEERAAERRTGGRMPGKKLWILAVAAILAFGTVTAGAAAYMKWSKSLSDGMAVEEEQKRELEDAHMAAPIDQSVTDQGVTVTMVQTIVDQHFLRISLKVEGYEPPQGEQPDFGRTLITIDGKNIDDAENEEDYVNLSSYFFDNIVQSPEDGKAVNLDGTPFTEDQEISYVLEDGSMEYNIVLFNAESEDYFMEKPIHLELTGLGGLYLEGYRPNIEGTWSFDWNLERSDMVRACSPDIALGDTGAVVEKIEISPISAQVTYRFPRTKTKEKGYNDSGEEIDVELTEEPPELIGVKMKDGTTYSYLYGGPGSCGFSSDEGEEYIHTFGLNRILDTAQIESFLFLKSIPEDEEPLTEENFYIVPANEKTAGRNY